MSIFINTHNNVHMPFLFYIRTRVFAVNCLFISAVNIYKTIHYFRNRILHAADSQVIKMTIIAGGNLGL